MTQPPPPRALLRLAYALAPSIALLLWISAGFFA
jgi:hypothetical protein